MVNRKNILTLIMASTIVVGGILGKEYLDSKVRERADANQDGNIDQTEMWQLYQDLELKIYDQTNLKFPGLSGYQAIKYLER